MPAERTDWFQDTCYVGEHQKLMSPEAFRRQFCALCRNAQCSESVIGKSRWQARMDTQEDRLLVHPQFGDPHDPRFRDVTALEFEDRLREAMALEISSQRNNWEPVSEADVSAALGEMPKDIGGLKPAGFQAPEETGPAQGPVMLWDGQAKGTGGTLYRVTLMRLATGEEVWSCTCPAFQFRGGSQCKHIVEAAALRDQTELPAPLPVVPPKPSNTSPATQQKWDQVRERGLLPKAKNTAFPPEGMMIDGSPPPPVATPDPWAVPAPTAPVVPVGGRVVLGGKKEG